MSSAGPVLLGRVRCALDGPVKAAAGDVDVTDVPGSPSELDSPIRSRDQSQTWWIQRWTHRTFLCVAVIVAACLSGALACELYRSSSYKVRLHFSCLLSYCEQCASWGSSCLAVGSLPQRNTCFWQHAF